LQKISTATHRLNYTGTFVYQRDKRMETSRITHLVDETGEHAKLVAMDGTVREMYRVNNDVLCFLPDSKTAVVDKSRAKKIFPTILPDQISSLKESYDAKLGGRARVAGREAQIVILEPRDHFRYGHRFWADTKTGLLLRAGVWRDSEEMVDRFSFSQVSIGVAIDKSEVKPKLTGRKLIQNDEGQSPDGEIDPGWSVNAVPPGFKRISAMKRLLPGGKAPVNHIVFSDGLAAVSVFIEPASGEVRSSLSHRGALHVYTRTVAEHEVKVLGEAPAVTVRQIGDSVTYAKQ
jgi:sigma-E factor negative regulatory protein RseB